MSVSVSGWSKSTRSLIKDCFPCNVILEIVESYKSFLLADTFYLFRCLNEILNIIEYIAHGQVLNTANHFKMTEYKTIH